MPSVYSNAVLLLRQVIVSTYWLDYLESSVNTSLSAQKSQILVSAYITVSSVALVLLLFYISENVYQLRVLNHK